MKLMGMKGYLHWFAWMFKFATSLTISCFLITGIFFIPTRNGAIINHSDPYIVMLFLCLYGLAIVTFGFAVSAFFAHSMHCNTLPNSVQTGLLGRIAAIAGKSGLLLHTE